MRLLWEGKQNFFQKSIDKTKAIALGLFIYMRNPGLKAIGKRFGSLVAVERIGVKHGQGLIRCECDCGNKDYVAYSSLLIRGMTKQCKRCAYLNLRRHKERIPDLRKIFEIRVRPRKGIKVLIDEHQFEEVAKNPCFYCGKPPEPYVFPTPQPIVYVPERERLALNGLDRIDPSGHYSMDNIVSCCSRCNMAKRLMSKEEFITMVKEIFENLQRNEKNILDT